MKKKFVFNSPRYHSVMKFLVVGCLNTAIDFSSFMLFFYVFHIPLLVANALSFGVSSINSYLLNSLWTFRQGREQLSLRNYAKFFGVILTGFFVSSIALWIFSRFMPAWLAKVASIGASLVLNYAGFSKIVFRPPPPANEP